MNTISYFYLVILVIMGISCTSHPGTNQDQMLPPTDLLLGNYELADQICMVVVSEIIAEDTLFSDSGDPGYVRYLFKTDVIEIIKGAFTSKSTLEFKTSAEYSESFISFWLDQEELLVFLRQDSSSGSLYTIEAGIIPSSEDLKQHIRKIYSKDKEEVICN